ncbi:uncharacterized protein EI90DRAFT_3101789 [Cantharellus anzutake]|uniref:uncharacterized protein n=1 Tax=Cantharellus anzutake TaxID=1750568 RepID=UPI0019086CE8|nr:uncharacterized protein EI90DRAFT_3101789 [Cantharellus anzutake]KAF8310233.1 hypothetical protein EI90DRAFT_3101789 [Cantharellus anzutake]
MGWGGVAHEASPLCRRPSFPTSRLRYLFPSLFIQFLPSCHSRPWPCSKALQRVGTAHHH